MKKIRLTSDEAPRIGTHSSCAATRVMVIRKILVMQVDTSMWLSIRWLTSSQGSVRVVTQVTLATAMVVVSVTREATIGCGLRLQEVVLSSRGASVRRTKIIHRSKLVSWMTPRYY